MKALNARRENEGEETLGFGIALHVGDVMFGNIGTPGRVEFSVTGPAANMAARIESMCKILGRPLLFSDTFAAILPEQLESVGRHRLEGMRNMPEIFSLPGL
jgi:adenylate cyclase